MSPVSPLLQPGPRGNPGATWERDSPLPPSKTSSKVFLNSFINKHFVQNHTCWQSGTMEESLQELEKASL